MDPESTFVPAPIKATVSLEEVDRLDIRVGTIERVDDLAKSDKLVKLTVNFGDHTLDSGRYEKRAGKSEARDRRETGSVRS
jgi:tRNA-binding protein